MTEERVHVEFATRSLNKYNEELCGDRVQMRKSDHSTVMVLADGLGSGVKANILSTLTSTILSEMIKEGAEMEDVVKTISATLPECKERHVAYSTFTILEVDHDGRTKLVEFENPAAIVVRDGKCLSLDRRDVLVYNRRVKISEFKSEPGDYVYFFSDGVLNAGTGEVLNLAFGQKEIEEYVLKYVRSDDPAWEACRILLACVNDLYQGKCLDDTTVAVCHIVESKESVVLVGPPSSKEMDRPYVEQLLHAQGKKMCCGGTTGEIVSRITGRPCSIQPGKPDAMGVPPIGKIRGIDLVTEGVLTLEKTEHILKLCAEDQDVRIDFLNRKHSNGAEMLAAMLLGECTRIRFLVGCASNPAYAELDSMLLSLSGKKRLVQKMAMELEKAGKTVSVEYY